MMMDGFKEKAKGMAAGALEKARNVDMSAIREAAGNVADKAKAMDLSAVKGVVSNAAARAKSLTNSGNSGGNGGSNTSSPPLGEGENTDENSIDARIQNVATALAQMQASLGAVARELAAIRELSSAASDASRESEKSENEKSGSASSRVLVVVSGGNVQITSDEGADCQVYNFDDHESNALSGGVPARFHDLAEEFGVPVADAVEEA